MHTASRSNRFVRSTHLRREPAQATTALSQPRLPARQACLSIFSFPVDDVVVAFPTLTREHVLACLEYSARLMKHHFTVQAVA